MIDVSTLRHAAELCEFCPKMCRFTCPASEAAQREPWTPWGKVSLAALTVAIDRPPDASAALAFHACTGCLRCQEYCAHRQDVPALLYASRAAAVRSGVQPPALQGLLQRFAEQGHAVEGDPLSVLRALRSENARPRAAPRAMLVPGCEALSDGASVARDALSAARALGAPLDVAPDGALCCGRKLIEAGHPEEFAAHAARTGEALASSPGPAHLVFLNPACARTVRDRYPAGARVEHATTYLARALALRPELFARPKLPGPIAYHDPCDLARGLDETEAPRRILAAAVDGGALDAVRCGRDAACCGASGLFPQTFPEVAARVAGERKAELAETNAPVASASPACEAALGASDVVSILARWLS